MSKTKRTIRKTSKRRLVVFGIPSIIVIGYFFINLLVYSTKIYNLKLEQKNLTEDLVNMQAKEKNLKQEIEKLKDEEYLAKYARENYQYSRDGELVFKLPDKEVKKRKNNKLDINTNYIMVGGTSIIILAILYVLKKQK